MMLSSIPLHSCGYTIENQVFWTKELMFTFRMDCKAQQVAILVETLQAGDRVGARTVTMQADLCIFQAYFEEMEKRWPSGIKYSRLFNH